MIRGATKVFLLDKDINISLAYKLHSNEFKCKCSRVTCNQILFSPNLKTSWNSSRTEFDSPLVVNSGHRCLEHNKEVGGVLNSKHTKGEALDISHSTLSDLEKIRLKKILEKWFDVVIEYPTFYHCHNNTD